MLEINRRCARAFYEKGNALARLGKQLEAVISYDQALEIEPDNPKTLYQKGIALAQRERYDDAIKTFERMLALEPDNSQALYYLGIAYAAGNGTMRPSGRLNDPSNTTRQMPLPTIIWGSRLSSVSGTTMRSRHFPMHLPLTQPMHPHTITRVSRISSPGSMRRPSRHSIHQSR